MFVADRGIRVWNCLQCFVFICNVALTLLIPTKRYPHQHVRPYHLYHIRWIIISFESLRCVFTMYIIIYSTTLLSKQTCQRNELEHRLHCRQYYCKCKYISTLKIVPLSPSSVQSSRQIGMFISLQTYDEYNCIASIIDSPECKQQITNKMTNVNNRFIVIWDFSDRSRCVHFSRGMISIPYMYSYSPCHGMFQQGYPCMDICF